MTFPLPHRDDLDPEMLKELEERFAGFKVVCVGDIPDDQMDDETKAMLEHLENIHQESVRNGTCIDCGKSMPNWPPDSDDWEPATDWRWFENPDKSPAAWQCPECDAAESS